MATDPAPVLTLQRASYRDAGVQHLVATLQSEYAARYGGPDDTPVEPDAFAPPSGDFVVAYVGDEPVAMGGWRWHEQTPDQVPGRKPVEVKRMYVVGRARGRGFARAVLRRLEDSARSCGADWSVLMTGERQPEAVALYRSCGYVDIPAFGYYAEAPLAIHLGKQLDPLSP